MTDSEQRKRVLQLVYENRKSHGFLPQPTHFDPPINRSEIVRLCKQLAEREFIEAAIYNLIEGGPTLAACSITAAGAEWIENGGDMASNSGNSNNTINFSGTGNLIVGNNNQLSINHHVHELVKTIESSNGTPEQKAEAKGLLRQFLEHPLFAAVAGGAIGLLG